MKKPLKIAVLMLCATLTGCGWDMSFQGWARATELCAPFGGIRYANQRDQGGGTYFIEAQCANLQTVSRFFTRSEMSNASQDR